MDAQLAFAEAAFAAGERDEAADTLLRMVETDPEWNDGAAKAKLLQMFEAVGLEDPWVGGDPPPPVAAAVRVSGWRPACPSSR